MADVVHICAPGHEQGPVVHEGVPYQPWPHHDTAGRVYWLVYGPRELSSCPSGGTPSGLVVAPAELGHHDRDRRAGLSAVSGPPMNCVLARAARQCRRGDFFVTGKP